MPRRHRIPALLAAAALAFGAAACGGDSGDREDVDQGNEGQLTAPGSQSTVEEAVPGLTSTGEERPDVTQPETGP